MSGQQTIFKEIVCLPFWEVDFLSVEKLQKEPGEKTVFVAISGQGVNQRV